MLFAVVLPSTESYEKELNINNKGREEVNSIIKRKDCDKVIFKGFIEGKTLDDCKNKVIKLSSETGQRYRLYGSPFTRRGNLIYMKRND